MKLLYLAPDALFMPKGAAVRIQRTLETYASLGCEVHALTPQGNQAAPRCPFDHHPVPLDSPNFLQRMMQFRAAAREWLETQNADVIQFRSIWEGVAALDWAKRHGAFALYEPHGFPSIELKSHYPQIAENGNLLEKIIAEENQVLYGADGFVTPSQTNARFLMMRGVDPAKITVVPNVVDTNLFTPPITPPPDQPPYRVVYTGTLAPWQGLSILLQALVPFKNRSLLELHVVGPWKQTWRHELRRLARKARIHPLVHISRPMSQQDLVPVLQTAHLTVAPLTDGARNELQGCCPLKILEYMGCATPLLSTRTNPVLEILEHERTAHLVKPGCPLALSEGLETLLSQPDYRQRLGQAAHQEAMRAWTPSIFAARLQGLVAKLRETRV